ncbi:MAG: glycosyltransferase family 4 protein [candidate division WOR-3 bacterium]
MRERIRVLYIVTAFPRHEGDVITPWLWTLIRELMKRGVEAEVLASSYKGMSDGELWGIRVHRWRYAPARWETLSHDMAIPEKLKQGLGPKIMIVPFLLGGLIKAMKLAGKRKYDLVHVHWPFPLALLALPFRIPKIYTFYTAEIVLAEKFGFLRGVFQALVNRARAITFLTRYGLSRFSKTFKLPCGSRAVVIPFMPAGEPVELPGVKREEKRLLFVGRLVERKGVAYLLRAVRILRGLHPDVRLVVVGTGPEEKNLRDEAEALGIQDSVDFLGSVSEEEKAREYAMATVFVLPAIVDSRGDTEGQGVVILEAMRAGLPTVASAVGGITDLIVDRETGFLVPEKDSEALSAVLARLLNSPDERKKVAIAALNRLDRDFGPVATNGRLIELYEEVLDHPG